MWMDEFKDIKSGKKELGEFGVLIGAILIVLADIGLWRGRGFFVYPLVLGLALVVLGLAMPQALKRPQRLWMQFALILGFVMNRVIMTLFFYAVLTPLSLTLRIMGKDILDERIDKSRVSYWNTREDGKRDKAYYENQY